MTTDAIIAIVVMVTVVLVVLWDMHNNKENDHRE
jgi:heme/copper-type cytochrome/quinol oxidase subunit 4